MIFWTLLRSGVIGVKISDFIAGRPDVSYINELSHMLLKNLLFQGNNAQIFHFK